MHRLGLTFLILILALNVFSIINPDPLTQLKLKSFSLSRGDSYYYTLQLWYYLAKIGDWQSASRLAPRLDPRDISLYFSQNSPQSIKRRLNQLTTKSDKTVEDYIELARLQLTLGKLVPAISSLTQAKSLDPIRDDIDLMLSQLRR